MKPYISLVTLGVADIARSRSFYEGVLGLPVKAALGDFIAYELNNIVLALFPRDALAKDAAMGSGDSGFSGITLAHNVADDEEVIALIETVRSSGNRIVKEPTKVEWGDCLGAYFADPDGHLWEVTSNPSGLYETHTQSDHSVQKRM